MQFSLLCLATFGISTIATPVGSANDGVVVTYPESYKRMASDDAIAYPDSYKRSEFHDAA
ncbi:hypothetical protein EPUS_03140 [Endocarpon pusillum Z07020]|uniref:Uncharacterized protein n=1 Tax=Endocarpon pusillum (strain Z07020 / HMAS-L-300199) TaxID=1263415 RepID=U1G7C0_ENDPU|nr:uncharacterized protein EPUS_03140 [Endocarpon pusillum Z07020]ERF73307.1 hypothetical protein EPUS_03140 [Endocarpon pusillum Z07020]